MRRSSTEFVQCIKCKGFEVAQWLAPASSGFSLVQEGMSTGRVHSAYLHGRGFRDLNEKRNVFAPEQMSHVDNDCDGEEKYLVIYLNSVDLLSVPLGEKLLDCKEAIGAPFPRPE